MNKKRRLLICDDDKTDIKLFKKYLGPEKLAKYELLESSNPEEFFSILNSKKSTVDLVFLDFYLGAQNGLELLKEIRVNNLAPVIMLTGRGDEEVAVECMKEGAMDYISKDTLPEYDLEKAINNAIGKWKIEQERDQLLGIAAHELRNPIAVILGYTELLQTYDDIDELKKNEIVDIIRERSHHLLNIINELLNITRIDKGIIVLNKIQYDIVALLQKKVHDYKLIADKKKIDITFSPSLPSIIVNLDPNRIEEVLSNFIDNAIKYSKQGTVVNISVAQNNNKIEIKIEDHGLGIKEEEVQFLFNLFSSKKISTLPTGDESRTGLGLAICKKVIDAHGGEILVESKVGKGSTFSILLPVE